jgi:hypothetical protein
VDADVSEIVDRLRGVRSARWLRVIDDADLDRPAEDEPSPDVVTAPYRWLLDRVGDGIPLTKAGYLPTAFVSAAMRELGWTEEWYGEANREVHAAPVRELRETAQRFGLLRKNRGQLLVTKLGGRLVDDPDALWWHLADHLPDARSEPERHAGVLYLLTVAAGRPMDRDLLAEGMSILGWVQSDARESLEGSAAFGAARDTWAFFHWLRLLPKGLRWNDEVPPAPSGRTLARAALLGRGGAPVMHHPVTERAAERAVQLFVQLRDIEPAIWRRVVVPASMTLHELHGVIQTAMGWEGYHLHLFEIDDVLYGDVEDFEGRLGDEHKFSVGDAAVSASEFRYEYDFGDSWDHDIRVEQVMPTVGSDTPHVIDGARRCPPEDSGGSGGYQRLLTVLADPAHAAHEDALHWAGDGFDPESFDLAEINADLELFDRHTRQRRIHQAP